MDKLVVAVFSENPDLLEQVRARCPDFRFEKADASRLVTLPAIFDLDSTSGIESPPTRARILLSSHPETLGARRYGELIVQPSRFIADPSVYLELLGDLENAMQRVASVQERLRLADMLEELGGLTSPESVYDKLIQTVLEIVGESDGSLLLHDPRVERFVGTASAGNERRESTDYLAGISESLVREALESGDGYAVESVAGGQAEVIAIPISSGDDVIGVAEVRASGPIDRERAAAAARYVRLANALISSVYQLDRSRDLVMRDDLTKAYNRRFFDAYLDEEIERARRYSAALSIIFLDLDDLKLVNNAHGHLGGSRTLQEVARRILGAVRTIDKVVRFGGDEFCIILPQTDQAQAVAVAIRVRAAIAESTFRLDPQHEISVTASFGVATYPQHGRTKDELIRQADAAMFRVKSKSKNSIAMAEGPPEQSAATVDR